MEIPLKSFHCKETLEGIFTVSKLWSLRIVCSIIRLCDHWNDDLFCAVSHSIQCDHLVLYHITRANYYTPMGWYSTYILIKIFLKEFIRIAIFKIMHMRSSKCPRPPSRRWFWMGSRCDFTREVN